MPVESRLFVKASLLWLCATFALGAILLILKALGLPIHYNFSNVHAHMGFVGWLVNSVGGADIAYLVGFVVAGVVYWLLESASPSSVPAQA